MSDVIKFDFNVPVECALRFTEPRVFPSQFENGDDRHMFSTTDGRVMYVTPLTSARINALHLEKGECFWICKRKNGRLTEFAVSRERMSAAPSQLAAPRPPATFKSKLPEQLYYSPEAANEPAPTPTLEEQLRASIDMVQRRKAQTVGEHGDGTLAIMAPPESVRKADSFRKVSANLPESVRKVSANLPESVRFSGQSPESVRIAPAVAEFSSRLIMETTALVDVYAAVLKTASERHGHAVKADDVRSFVVTAYINASKQAGRNAA
jgi:hypothetical protein